MSDEKPGDSDVTAEAAPTETDKKGLNDLLASWDDTPKDSSDDAPKGDKSALAEEVGRMSYQLEIDKLIPKVKGDLKISDKFVEAYMNMRANDDPRLRTLWDDRHNRRAEFDLAMTAIGEELKKEVGSAPKEVVEADDTKGLAAAVHAAREGNTGDGGFDTVNWGGLSDSEFALKKAEVFRLAESGQLE